MQRRTASGNRKKAVHIRMRTRAGARIRPMLGEHCQTMFGRFGIQAVEELLQILVYGQRALLAGLGRPLRFSITAGRLMTSPPHPIC